MHLFQTHRQKPGTSPGKVEFVGERKVDEVVIRSFNYDTDTITELSHDSIEEIFEFRDNQLISWVNIDGLHDVSIIEKVGKHFAIHPLVLEDIASTNQRPKIEFYDDHVYIVMKMIVYDESKRDVNVEQISLVLGKDFVLSFQERRGDVFDPVRKRLRAPEPPRIRRMKADYLAYTLIDVIVDYYFITLEKLGEAIESLEDEVTYNPSSELQRQLREIKHNLIIIRRATWPVRELLSQLDRSESRLVSKSVRPFVRDVYDHAVQVIDIVESLRDLLAGLMDLYMTGISNRMNDIMKVLTIIGTIFIPLTFIAGIYGMNFENMPELHSQNGYFISLGVMGAIAIVLLLLFKRKDWI